MKSLIDRYGRAPAFSRRCVAWDTFMVVAGLGVVVAIHSVYPGYSCRHTWRPRAPSALPTGLPG